MPQYAKCVINYTDAFHKDLNDEWVAREEDRKMFEKEPDEALVRACTEVFACESLGGSQVTRGIVAVLRRLRLERHTDDIEPNDGRVRVAVDVERLKRLLAKATEVCDDLQCELEARWLTGDTSPARVRKLGRDLQPVQDCRVIIAALEKEHEFMLESKS